MHLFINSEYLTLPITTAVYVESEEHSRKRYKRFSSSAPFFEALEIYFETLREVD